MNPVHGEFLHRLDGFESASFHVPCRRVRHRSLEIFWLAGGILFLFMMLLVFSLLTMTGRAGVTHVLKTIEAEMCMDMALTGVMCIDVIDRSILINN